MAFLESSFESENNLKWKGTFFKLRECRGGWISRSALMATTGAEYEQDRSAMVRMACVLLSRDRWTSCIGIAAGAVHC